MKKEIIQWSDSINPEDDLCGRYKGHWIDVVQDYKGYWQGLYDCNRVTEKFVTRDDAKENLENFIKFI